MFTAHIVTYVDGVDVEHTEVPFNSRQNAIDYLWPFYKSRSTHRTYKCTIVTPDGKTLFAPSF